MIEAYVDDSGRGQGIALILSGYVAAPEQWNAMRQEWQQELSVAPTIRYFKMKEAASGTGEFARHYPELVTHRINKLIDIIERRVLLGITSVVMLDAFDNIMVPRFENETDHPLYPVNTNPYFAAFYNLVVLLHHFMWKSQFQEPVEFIFDEQGNEGRKVASFWEAFRDVAPSDLVRETMTRSPRFESDTDCPPLQAADMTAWHFHNHFRKLFESRRRGEANPQPNPIFERLSRINRVQKVLGYGEFRRYVTNYENVLRQLRAGETPTFS